MTMLCSERLVLWAGLCQCSGMKVVHLTLAGGTGGTVWLGLIGCGRHREAHDRLLPAALQPERFTDTHNSISLA